MSSKVAAYYRRKIRGADGVLKSSPRFPRTPKGREAANLWYEDKKIEKKLITSGVRIQFTPMTVAVFSKEWMKDRKGGSLSPSTWIEDEKKLLNRILPKWGKREIHTIQPAEFKSWFTAMIREGLHTTTVHHYRALLSKFYNDAMKAEPPHCKENPVSLIPGYAKYDLQKKPKVWNEEQCALYLKTARSFGLLYYLAAMFYLNSGGRQAEVFALRNEDMDLENNQFTIMRVKLRVNGEIRNQPKSGKERTLGINPLLREAYLEWLGVSEFKAPSDYILVDERGELLTSSKFWYWHKKIINTAKLPYLNPHGMRHTFASLFMKADGSQKSLQGLLGHGSQRTTDRYTHFIPGFLQSQASYVQVDAEKVENEKTVISTARRRSKSEPKKKGE